MDPLAEEALEKFHLELQRHGVDASVVGIRWKANSTELATDIASRLSADLGIQEFVLAIGAVEINKSGDSKHQSSEPFVTIFTERQEAQSPSDWGPMRAITLQTTHAIASYEG